MIGDAFDNRACVIFGGGLSSTANVVGHANWITTGEQTGDQFGTSLGQGGLDADGTQDLIIGARSHVLSDRADPHFNDAGAVYISYGATRATSLSSVGITGVTQGVVKTAYAFSATVNPVTVTLPITSSGKPAGNRR